jgi:hypothetical protein
VDGALDVGEKIVGNLDKGDREVGVFEVGERVPNPVGAMDGTLVRLHTKLIPSRRDHGQSIDMVHCHQKLKMIFQSLSCSQEHLPHQHSHARSWLKLLFGSKLSLQKHNQVKDKAVCVGAFQIGAAGSL